MFCPKCKTRDISRGNFCHKCGARLKADRKRNYPVLGWAFLSIFLVLGVVVLMRLWFHQKPVVESGYRGNPVVKNKDADIKSTAYVSSIPVAAVKEGVERPGHLQAPVDKSLAAAPAPVSLQKESDTERVLLAGEVKVYDVRGNEIASVSSGALAGGLVAIPRRACLGGINWLFLSREKPDAVSIGEGLWKEGDEIGLWRIKGDFSESLSLATWDSTLPLSWLSLETGVAVQGLNLRPEYNQGDILPLLIPEELSAAGVFVQREAVVGWTFGEWLSRGYLWNRPVPTERDFRMDIDRFYDITFAGGREEQFAKAIFMGEDTSAAQRLQAFVRGVKLEPKLSLNDTPERLYLENVLVDIRYLSQMLRYHGEIDQLSSLIDNNVIASTRDLELFTIVAGAIAESGDYAGAVEFIEENEVYFAGQDSGIELQKMLLHLYRSWLNILIAEKNTGEGWEVVRSGASIFPEDPELHLGGVELALLDGDWARAEDLLYQRDYPLEFRQKIALLSSKVSDMKSREGKIVIQFPSGSTRIPVVARVNNRQDIDFLVDTGATMVTVPVALLDSLGVRISSSTPRRVVSTAGGLAEAWLVNLSSIELGGWIVYDLEALAIDIPSHSQIGLLGLNFLEKFRMDLNTEKGILLLEPL